MSKIRIQGNASGTGVVTLTAPNTNTDRTITLPDGDITLGGGVDGIVSTANATAITIDSSENVGIGTTSPAAKLHVSGGAGSTIRNTATSGSSWFVGSNIDSYILHNESNTPMVFTTNGAERMRIDSSGNVGIGKTSINTGLAGFWYNNSGKGLVLVSNSGTVGDEVLYLNRTSGGTGSLEYVDMRYNGTNVGGIQCNSSSTSYITSSDYRLKENVAPMTGSIDRLKALKPSRFNFKADKDTTVDGFLAHEAGEVVPECVAGTKDAMVDEEYEVTPAVMDGDTVVTEAVMGTRSVPDYQGIDQSKLVPLLVASLQEAIARIEQLENA